MNWSALITLVMSYTASLLFMMLVQRPLFILYNRKHGKGIRVKDLWQIYRHGILSDFIVAAYLTIPVLPVLWVWFNIPFSFVGIVLGVITGIISLAVSLISLGDTALYDFWHFKIDSSVLHFLKSPKAAFASVTRFYLILAFIGVMVVAAIYFAMLMGTYHAGLKLMEGTNNSPIAYVVGNLLFILALALLALIIRGLRIRPNNPTIVLFSPIAFYNHAALNSIFNFTYSMSRNDPYSGQFKFMDDGDAEKIVADLYPREDKEFVKILNNDRPNILIIVWESLSARFVEFTGGNPEVTPYLNRYAREGVAFTRCNCGSFLTDRGLACIFSGLPGQPTASIGQHTRKLPGLPGFPRQLKAVGYETKIVTGGDLSVRQKADYYLASGHDTLIAQKDFPKSAPSCKWGVHDEVVFDYLYDDILDKTRRGVKWMTTVQTLSSHESFIVPYNRLPDKMENAFAYTDECFGKFIERLKKTDAWKNLMIVCVGDHGVHYSSEYGMPLPQTSYPHIPALIFGGAVKAPMVVDTLMSQTDLAATILAQLGLSHEEYPFSRNILSNTYKHPFTYQSSHHNITIEDEHGAIAIDTDSGDVVEGEKDSDKERNGKAVLQVLYSYLSKL